MLAAALAALSSVVWGTSDFRGGLITRTYGVLRVIAWSQLASLVVMWAIVGGFVWLGRVAVEPRTVLIAAGGGVAAIIGLASFYHALATGPMSLVPPIAASGVVVPIVVGFVRDGRVTALAVVGVTIALAGVIMASLSGGSTNDTGPTHQVVRMSPQVLALCVCAAVGFGVFFVLLDAAAASSPATALVATAGVRIGSILVVLPTLVLTRTAPWQRMSTASVIAASSVGIMDTTANVLFAVASSVGRMQVVALLGSLYPAVTSALAHIVLHERLAVVQALGVALTLGGVALLALA